MQCFAASGFKQIFDKSQTSQRQVYDKISTQRKVGNLVADLVLDKIDLMEFGLKYALCSPV